MFDRIRSPSLTCCVTWLCRAPTRRRPAVILPVFGLLASLLGAGCQGPLGSGIRAFEESRFVHAAETLRPVSASDLSPEERARWALYLGLSELSLGNLNQAVLQLCAARVALRETPAALSPVERGQLESAWQAIGRMPSEPLTRAYPCAY